MNTQTSGSEQYKCPSCGVFGEPSDLADPKFHDANCAPQESEYIPSPLKFSLTMRGLDKKEAKQIAEDVYGDTFRWSREDDGVIRAYPGSEGDVCEIREETPAPVDPAPVPPDRFVREVRSAIESDTKSGVSARRIVPAHIYLAELNAKIKAKNK